MESKFHITIEMLSIMLRLRDITELLDLSIKCARILFRDTMLYDVKVDAKSAQCFLTAQALR